MLASLLRRYLRPYQWPLVAVVVLQFIGTMASLWLPSLNADIIDNGVAKGDTGYVLHRGAIMLGVSLIQIVCSITAVWFGSRLAMGFGRDTRAAIFQRVGSFSAAEMARYGAPTLITRTTNDVQQVQMLVLMTCTMLISAPIMAVGGVIMAMQQDAGLSWLIGVSVVTLLLVIGLIVSRMVPLFRRMQVRLDAVNRVLREQITGIRVVRAFVREPQEQARFEEANTALTSTALSAGRLMALIFPSVMLILNVSSVGVLFFGADRIDAGEMQIGALTAFLAYLMQILMSILMATFMLVLLPRASVSADRIGEVLATETTVVVAENAISDLPLSATVEFDAAGYQYHGADEPVLQGVTVRCLPGQTTAIIGSTGSGKTTMLNLVPRLFDATSGRVVVDGVDVRDIAPAALQARIGLVPQKALLFSGTIASNLRVGRDDATEADMWDALRVAQAEEFVRGLEQGLDSPVAQGGTNFSGGQRQRLAIARAVVRKPEIFLFDDSFSALDMLTDSRLRQALRPLTREATVIVVAQRVASIVEADQIVVLDGGRVVGLGKHDDLVLTCPTYAEIVASQAALEEASA